MLCSVARRAEQKMYDEIFATSFSSQPACIGIGIGEEKIDLFAVT